MSIKCPHCGWLLPGRNHPASRQTMFRERQREICDKFGIITFETLYREFPKLTPPQIWSAAHELVRQGFWKKLRKGTFEIVDKEKKVLDITDEVC